MRFLIIFIFLTTNVFGSDVSTLKNIIVHKAPKTYDNVIFLDKSGQKININQFKGSILILNFWATWCKPCKEEMPSLDILQVNPDLNQLKIFPINVGKEKLVKINKFFEDLNIRNIQTYYDSPSTLAKTFSLRGIPTSILLDKDGNEFARIIGSINFEDENFLSWIKKYN